MLPGWKELLNNFLSQAHEQPSTHCTSPPEPEGLLGKLSLELILSEIFREAVSVRNLAQGAHMLRTRAGLCLQLHTVEQSKEHRLLNVTVLVANGLCGKLHPPVRLRSGQ